MTVTPNTTCPVGETGGIEKIVLSSTISVAVKEKSVRHNAPPVKVLFRTNIFVVGPPNMNTLATFGCN
jgi:hypothetical protein